MRPGPSGEGEGFTFQVLSLKDKELSYLKEAVCSPSEGCQNDLRIW